MRVILKPFCAACRSENIKTKYRETRVVSSGAIDRTEPCAPYMFRTCECGYSWSEAPLDESLQHKVNEPSTDELKQLIYEIAQKLERGSFGVPADSEAASWLHGTINEALSLIPGELQP